MPVNATFSHEKKTLLGDLKFEPLVWFSFSLSFISASFGITKFLKAGPIGIVRAEKWLDGFGTLTFILIIFNVAATMLGGGLIISNTIYRITKTGGKYWYLLILINYAPSFLHVSTC